MPDAGRRGRDARSSLVRADLPEQFTPDTVRALDVYTTRMLARHDNGVLGADEQRQFDTALRAVMQDTTDRLEQSLRRVRGGGPGGPRGLDPQLRRSYTRTEARLAEQARRARVAFPELTGGWGDLAAPADEPTADVAEHDDAISLGALESEIEQTSDTLEILERIASIQQQQLEHQRTQVLRDVRGVFFAVVASVAVIVAGVAPLVEATSHDRRLIAVWTAVVCATAGVVYALVRAAQSRSAKSSLATSPSSL